MKLIKYLPKSVRQQIARFLVKRDYEYSGILYDYLPIRIKGKMEMLIKWSDDRGQEDAWKVIQAAHDSGRDFLYLGTIKTGEARGYFVLHSPNIDMLLIGFVPKIYDVEEAFLDIVFTARQEAIRLGYDMTNVTIGKP
jgi:hypothetical protein